MGTYLSTPVTDIESEARCTPHPTLEHAPIAAASHAAAVRRKGSCTDGSNTERRRCRCVGCLVRGGSGGDASLSQGWRRTMEDEHIATALKLGDSAEGPRVVDKASLTVSPAEISMFGVWDGHAGSEVSKFVRRHMAEELLASPVRASPHAPARAGVCNSPFPTRSSKAVSSKSPSSKCFTAWTKCEQFFLPRARSRSHARGPRFQRLRRDDSVAELAEYKSAARPPATESPTVDSNGDSEVMRANEVIDLVRQVRACLRARAWLG
jgi:hypothetical protein